MRVNQCKVCSFWSCAFLAFAPLDPRVHGKAFSLSYHAIVIFEQLILFFNRLIFPLMYFTKSWGLVMR